MALKHSMQLHAWLIRLRTSILLLHLLERIHDKLSRKDSPSAVSPSPRKDPSSTVSPRRKVSPSAASPSPRKDPSSAVSSERIHHQLLLHLLERVNQQLLLIHHVYRASPSPRKEPPAAVSYASLLERIHHQLLYISILFKGVIAYHACSYTVTHSVKIFGHQPDSTI